MASGQSTTIKVDIVGDGSNAQRSARRTAAAYDRMGNRIGGVGSAAQDSRGRVRRFGSAVAGAAKRFGPLAGAAAAAGIAKIGLDSIRAASDVEQAFGAINSVFEDNAAKVKQWANGAAESVGLAKSEYANLSVVLGSMLKNTGIEGYTTKTRKLVQLGADLAATFGGTTQDAVTALAATLRGEYDSIEQYGVSIKQADVNARLASKGLTGLTGKSKKQAEQTARLELLFKQTSDASGAFARESDTLANKQQKLTAKFENLKAKLGKQLMPVAEDVTQWLTDTISGTNDTSDALRGLGSMIRDYLRPWLNRASDAFDILTDALDDVDGKSESTKQTWKDVHRWASKLATIAGILGGNNLILLANGFNAAMQAARLHWQTLAKVYDWANAAAGAVDDLYDSLGRVSMFGGLGGLLSALNRSGSSLPNLDGLARAGGAGAIIRPPTQPAPRVSVSSSPRVTVMIDGRALDSRMVRLVHDEMDSAAVTIARAG